MPDGVGTNDSCSIISSDIEWKFLANAISRQGALPGIQLSSVWNTYDGIRRFIPKSPDEQAANYKRIGSQITAREALAAFDSLNKATELAISAGFRHLQVHAAHGYLFNLLIDPELSSHSDLTIGRLTKWANELRLEGYETSLRFSMWAGHEIFDANRGYSLIDKLALIPVDFLDASAGFYNIDKRLIYPSAPAILQQRLSMTLDIANRLPEINVISSGLSSNAWNGNLPNNVHIGICRDLIANPDYLLERGNGCTMCMKCHYFSRKEKHLTCGKWN